MIWAPDGLLSHLGAHSGLPHQLDLLVFPLVVLLVVLLALLFVLLLVLFLVFLLLLVDDPNEAGLLLARLARIERHFDKV